MILLNILLKDTFRHQVYIFSALEESDGVVSNINTAGPFGFDSQLTIVSSEKFELREFQKLINQFVESYNSTMTIMPVAQDLITEGFIDWEVEEKRLIFLHLTQQAYIKTSTEAFISKVKAVSWTKSR